MSLAAGSKLGSYEILAPIGKGGMGEVYRARDLKLQRDVAIKFLPAQFCTEAEWLARFRREARMLAALNHPNIASIYGLEENEAVPYLILELVEGETLAQRLARDGAVPAPETLRICIQIAEALEAAHQRGITHRDIKPANVKLTPEGRIKVLDFGLAKRVWVPHDQEDLTLTMAETQPGRIIGTPGYMSPEQVRGQAVDERTDIWAFGCVFYELLTGQRAYRGNTLSDTIAAILERPPEWSLLPTDTPETARALLARCLEKDASSRLQHISEARKQIERIQADRPGINRRKLMVAGACTAVVVAGSAIGMNFRSLRDRLLKRNIRVVAVLPLVNLSGNPDEEYFSDGVTEALITDLAKIGRLKVISRTSVMIYKGSKKPLQAIASDLNADAVLEGSAIRSGNRIRITVQLIDARSDQHLWAESYDRSQEDVLLLQSEVAQTIAQEIRGQLVSPDAEPPPARRVNPEAYDAYLKGRFYWARATRVDHDTAQEYFELAIAKDPSSPLGYAGIAAVWLGRQQMGYASPQEAAPKAVEAVNKALAIDNTLSEVHRASASVKAWALWDWRGAEDEYRRTIELNPSDAEARAYYAHVLCILKRNSEALPQAKQAVDLDPGNSLVWGLYATTLSYAGRYDEVIQAARHAAALSPDQRVGGAQLWSALYSKGAYREAVDALIALQMRNGRPEIVQALQRAGRQGYRAAFLAAAEAGESLWRSGRLSRAYQIAIFYERAGLIDRALEWYEKALDERDPNLPYIRNSIRNTMPENNPKFQAILRRIGIP